MAFVAIIISNQWPDVISQFLAALISHLFHSSHLNCQKAERLDAKLKFDAIFNQG